jgi:hypothetical protein
MVMAAKLLILLMSPSDSAGLGTIWEVAAVISGSADGVS